jgi:hypothetical protein
MSKRLWSDFTAGFIRRASYDIELISDLLVTTAAGVAYGYIEAFWVPTSLYPPATLRVFGRFAYYHIGFFALMVVLATGLVVTHYQWFDPEYHRAHIIYALATFAAILPLAFMVEDMSWFALQLRPIGPKDWTVIWGLGIKVGSTVIPAWYIGVILWAWIFLSTALTYAEKSYLRLHPEYMEKQKSRT